jgi:hypothetical protein
MGNVVEETNKDYAAAPQAPRRIILVRPIVATMLAITLLVAAFICTILDDVNEAEY